MGVVGRGIDRPGTWVTLLSVGGHGPAPGSGHDKVHPRTFAGETRAGLVDTRAVGGALFGIQLTPLAQSTGQSAVRRANPVYPRPARLPRMRSQLCAGQRIRLGYTARFRTQAGIWGSARREPTTTLVKADECASRWQWVPRFFDRYQNLSRLSSGLYPIRAAIRSMSARFNCAASCHTMWLYWRVSNASLSKESSRQE